MKSNKFNKRTSERLNKRYKVYRRRKSHLRENLLKANPNINNIKALKKERL